MRNQKVNIIKVISEHKNIKLPKKGVYTQPARGYKRVMAIININGEKVTRHCDTRDGKTAFAHS